MCTAMWKESKEKGMDIIMYTNRENVQRSYHGVHLPGKCEEETMQGKGLIVRDPPHLTLGLRKRPSWLAVCSM